MLDVSDARQGTTDGEDWVRFRHAYGKEVSRQADSFPLVTPDTK